MTLEDLETEIRIIVKDEFFKRTPKSEIDKKIRKCINDGLKTEKFLPVLKDAGKRSLWNFYQRQYAELNRSFIGSFAVLSAFMLLKNKSTTGEKIKPTPLEKKKAIQTLKDVGYTEYSVTGQPLNKSYDEYFKKNVNPAIDRLSKQFAIDPDDKSKRNSLRNRAEMEVRYQGHKDNIAELRASGVRLVIASTHADCSERCYPWQGRVYSLDHTFGITNDGRNYVPLEQATDIPYTTKAGITYMNGLLGFNCRHYLVAYEKGKEFNEISEKQELKQYEITKKQRELERNVRRWRIEAVENRGKDEKRYKKAKVFADKWYNKYVDYCESHQRAFYRSRVQI